MNNNKYNSENERLICEEISSLRERVRLLEAYDKQNTQSINELTTNFCFILFLIIISGITKVVRYFISKKKQ